MIPYFYYSSDGSITTTGMASSEEQFNSLPGSPVRGVADVLRNYVKKGVLLTYSDEQLAKKSSLPEYPSTWSNELMDWVSILTPSEITERRWQGVRGRRDILLQETDWTQLPDVPSGVSDKWKPYRQALRDVTLQPDPLNITWPTPPQG